MRAARAIIAIEDERLRQLNAEGYSEAHDDSHDFGELARHAAAHALSAAAAVLPADSAGLREVLRRRAGLIVPPGFAVKPHPARRHLVIAAALLVAEIERLDRYDAHCAAMAGAAVE